MPPSESETTFLSFGAQTFRRPFHTLWLVSLIFCFSSRPHSLAVTSPMSQNSFSLNSPPPVLFPNLCMTYFCILVSMVAQVRLACQPGPCTYRIPPPLGLLLCSSYRPPSFLFPVSSLSCRWVCRGLSPCSSLLSAASSQDLITIHVVLRHRTQPAFPILACLMGTFLWGVPQTPPLNSAPPDLNESSSLRRWFWLASLAGTSHEGKLRCHFLKVTLLESPSSSDQPLPPTPFSAAFLCSTYCHCNRTLFGALICLPHHPN